MRLRLPDPASASAAIAINGFCCAVNLVILALNAVDGVWWGVAINGLAAALCAGFMAAIRWREGRERAWHLRQQADLDHLRLMHDTLEAQMTRDPYKAAGEPRH